MKHLIHFLFLLLTVQLHASVGSELFEEANRLYDEEKYAKAIEGYQSILDKESSANLHYNLANAYFMNKQPGYAIFHYNKAEQLDPGNPDTQANLKFAQEALQIQIPERNIMQNIAYTYSVNTWAWLLTICGWSCLLIFIFIKLTSWKGALPWSCISVLLIIISISLTALTAYHLDRNNGTVLADETPLKRAPTKNSPANSYVTAGETLTVVDKHSSYIKVKTGDGKTGWVADSDFKKLWD